MLLRGGTCWHCLCRQPWDKAVVIPWHIKSRCTSWTAFWKREIIVGTALRAKGGLFPAFQAPFGPPDLSTHHAVPTGAGQGHTGLVMVVTESLFLCSLCLCWSLELCHHQPPEHRSRRVDDVSRVSFHFPAGREVMSTRTH